MTILQITIRQDGEVIEEFEVETANTPVKEAVRIRDYLSMRYQLLAVKKEGSPRVLSQTAEPDELLDLKAACKLLGGSKPIHPVTLYRGIKEGRFPAGIAITSNARRWRRSKLLAAIEAAEELQK